VFTVHSQPLTVIERNTLGWDELYLCLYTAQFHAKYDICSANSVSDLWTLYGLNA